MERDSKAQKIKVLVLHRVQGFIEELNGEQIGTYEKTGEQLKITGNCVK